MQNNLDMFRYSILHRHFTSVPCLILELFGSVKGGQIKYPTMLCAKISQVLFFKLRKNCSNGDFPIVEYTGIKILKGWISCYIESSLYIFCKKCLCSAKNNSFYPLQFDVSGHIINTKWCDG